jgi:C1A family cysteine protease
MKLFCISVLISLSLNLNALSLKTKNSHNQNTTIVKSPVFISLLDSVGHDYKNIVKKYSFTKKNTKNKKATLFGSNNKIKKKIKQNKTPPKKGFGGFNIKSFDQGNSFINNKIKEKTNFINNKIKETNKVYSKWINNYNKVINSWKKDRKNFLNNLANYKNNLIKLDNKSINNSLKDLGLTDTEKIKNNKFILKKILNKMKNIKKNEKKARKKRQKSNSSNSVDTNWHVINSALVPKIKNQGQRPTCAAFSGIRGIEILMAQNKRYKALSEQYFYWSSKPKCQSSPCNERGSWSLLGFLYSKKSQKPNIPYLNDCSYNSTPQKDNETQVPLMQGCQKGKVGIKSFYEVNSSKEIRAALYNNNPVIAAFRLSDNFFRNNGAIFLKDVKKFDSKKNHAAGHAVLLVGIMDLPKQHHQTEGKICYVLANSWGKGWGNGGHACISEKWFNQYRFNINFVAINELII